jgi:hypothetical protein
MSGNCKRFVFDPRGKVACFVFLVQTKTQFFVLQIAFVGLLPDIDLYLRNKEKMRKDAITLSRTTGTLLDCPICCEDELIGLDLIYCPQGHGVCRSCVRRQVSLFLIKF